MATHPEDTLTLPLGTDEITPAWLTAALGVRYPGVEVTAVHIGGVIWGTATKVRLLLDYNAAGHAHSLPATMFLKAGFGGHDHMAVVAPAYAREVEFFRNVAPQLPVRVPQCYFAGTDPRTGQGVLLLEDLLARNVSFGRATAPVSAEVAAATLDVQARFHAKWWEASELGALELHPGGLRNLMLYLLEEEHFDACMARPRAQWVPEPLRDRARVRAAAEAMWDLDQAPPHCMIHGDAHIGNMYFEPDGTPCYLDWQGAMRGPWAHDVTYFVVGALTVDERRRSEQDLLRHYLARLVAYGAPAPGFDEAWLAYRRHVIHGFFWVVNPEELQPEDVNEAEAERFSVAAADLDVLEALGV